jgi:hypothetical protein
MRVTRSENVGDVDITFNGIRMKEVHCFRYLEVNTDIYCGMKSKMEHRVIERDKFSGVLRKTWKGEGMSKDT